MKISKLHKFAWVFFALALGTTTVFAQGWKNGNRVNNNKKGMCLEQISGLTEEQKTQIQGMEEKLHMHGILTKMVITLILHLIIMKDT